MDQLNTLTKFKNVILREHKPAYAVLSDPDVALIRRELAGQLEVMPTLTSGLYTLQPHQYVGFVVLPTGRVIEIRPKVRIDVLFAMLARAHHLADFGPEPQAYTSVTDLFEFIVSFFVDMVEDLVARGVLRGFEPFEGELLALRGKVLVTETVRHRPVVRDRHWCAFTEFTADILENRILRLACDTLLAFPYRRVPDVSTRLRRLLRAFAGVAFAPFNVKTFDQLVYHRLNEHYRPALVLARLLLSYLSPSGSRGPHQFLAFLVNMDTLFERYVTTVLQETVVTARRGLEVIAPGWHTLDLDRQVTVKPDVVMYREEIPVLALDAKYKLYDPNSDVYQALAYCHSLGVPRAILAYPASEEIAALRHRIRPDGKTEVVLLPFELSGDVTDLRRQTEAFVEAVWREVA